MSDQKRDTTDTADENDHGAPADVREQMRQALERKRPHDSAGSAGGGKAGNKASAAHENHKVSREFRRKSGG